MRTLSRPTQAVNESPASNAPNLHDIVGAQIEPLWAREGAAMTTVVTCAFCRTPNAEGTRVCCECGHRPGVEKYLCDCAKCMRALDTNPRSAGSAIPQSAIRNPQSGPPVPFKAEPWPGEPDDLPPAAGDWRLHYAGGEDRTPGAVCRVRLYLPPAGAAIVVTSRQLLRVVRPDAQLIYRAAWSLADQPAAPVFLEHTHAGWHLVKFPANPHDLRKFAMQIHQGLCTSIFAPPSYLTLSAADAYRLIGAHHA